MSTTLKSILAAVAVFSLLAVPAQAGVLDGHALAYNNGTSWTGTSAYDNGLAAPNNLVGTVDFAVFTSADFATAFPGSSYVPTNGLVYTYQVLNSGTFAVSAEIVGVNNPASGIGQFENTVGEVGSSLFGFDNGGNAVWNFSNPFIGTGQNSYILAFSSPQEPILGSSITVDGGTFGVSMVPTPGPDPIPEPSSVLLISAGLLGVCTRRQR